MADFIINLNAPNLADRLNAEEALLRGFEETFAANRDALIAGTWTFDTLAKAEIDFLVENPENWGTSAYDEQDDLLPFVDDPEAAVALLKGDLVRRAKNDAAFLAELARGGSPAVKVIADASVTAGREGDERASLDTLRLIRFEGAILLVEEGDADDSVYEQESEQEGRKAMESRIEDLVYYATHSTNDEGEEVEDSAKWVEVSR